MQTALTARRSQMKKKAKKSDSPPRLRGTVLAFNISPKGQIEGALIETATGPTQLNFPKHAAEALARSMHVGSRLDIEAELETDEWDHPVYMAGSGAGEASGTIVRLNYALHGEVNGYHLEDQTFLHVKPEGAKKWKLRVGEQVKAIGSRRAGVHAVVLEVDAIERSGKRPPKSTRAERAG
jgi:hypothetical protein